MKKTALFETHLKLNGTMIDFAGWSLPIQYTSIIKEHLSVRQGVGVFDCSHMGNIFIDGKGTITFLNYLIANNMSKITLQKTIYTLLLYENATIIDDVMIYLKNEEEAILIVNACNIEKDFNWIKEKANSFSKTLNVVNHSNEYSLIALQGKESKKVSDRILKGVFDALKPFSFIEASYQNKSCLISKTGYTGEDGIECMIPNKMATSLFKSFIENGAIPCGLGARDCLRLEKGFSLYGHEINEDINPIEAGLEWTVDLRKEDFIGKKALIDIKKKGIRKSLNGFIIEERGIARHQSKIYDKKKNIIGSVTSGVYSPILKKSIGLAFISKTYCDPIFWIESKKKLLKATKHKRKFV